MVIWHRTVLIFTKIWMISETRPSCKVTQTFAKKKTRSEVMARCHHPTIPRPSTTWHQGTPFSHRQDGWFVHLPGICYRSPRCAKDLERHVCKHWRTMTTMSPRHIGYNSCIVISYITTIVGMGYMVGIYDDIQNRRGKKEEGFFWRLISELMGSETL